MTLEAKGLIRKTFFASLKTFIRAAGPHPASFSKGWGARGSGQDAKKTAHGSVMPSPTACTGQLYFLLGSNQCRCSGLV